MYELGARFPGVEVEPGANVLVSGPPMTGKRDLAFDVLSHGLGKDEGAIVVTTKDGAGDVRAAFDAVDGDEESRVGVVDCVTRQQGMGGGPSESETVRYASSPVDLTGIGIEQSDVLRHFYQDRGVTRNRVLLYSLSTLLMYSNLQTVFRFLHVFTGRIQSADALGLYVIDESAHDEQTMSTLKQLFDGAIEVRETETGREHRLVGLEGVGAEWSSA